MPWRIYIPEEGHWPINYSGKDPNEARAAYLKWAGRKRLPPGAVIDCVPETEASLQPLDPYPAALEWVMFVKRTNYPKLGWLLHQLAAKGIEFRFNGESFHAPIVEVQKYQLEAANAILAPVDEIADDAKRFTPRICDECGGDSWNREEDRCHNCLIRDAEEKSRSETEHRRL